MTTLLLALLALPAAAPDTVQTHFVKVGPSALVPGRTPDQDRAIVLIHGLSVHLISKEKPTKARLRTWQHADSLLVKHLGRDADVYSLAYSQTAPCDKVCEQSRLARHVKTLKEAGYREIVLVGHSAGGLIARHLVEDHPDLGVTKVIQVCSPNAGSGWAALKTARSVQVAFLTSLTRAARGKVLKERADRRIPKHCEFVCVVGSSVVGGDGVVPLKSQWSEDLQAQGVPAYALRTAHWEAMKTTRAAELLSRLVREKQPRWDERQVAEARKKLLGN
jgi:pimeloyl-ACP methyl ester carboxylesterase